MGIFTNDSSDILAVNNSRMKAYAAISKTVHFPHDMVSVFGSAPERSMSALAAGMAAVSLPKDRILHGLCWFMNLTDTDAKALAALAQDGNLLAARKIWENGEQDMSSLQNQLICCLLMDLRSYSRALNLASVLYCNHGDEFIRTISSGFPVLTPDDLMPLFLSELLRVSERHVFWWDKAVTRYGDDKVEYQWAEAKAAHSISRLETALNLAKTTEIHEIIDNDNIATRLMAQSEPHLRTLKKLQERHTLLLSRYATIADAVCEEILERGIAFYNASTWVPGLKEHVLGIDRFCYRYAATMRFKDRCRLNINILLSRKDSAPLFPNGTPDNMIFESDRKKRNDALCALLEALKANAEYGYDDFRRIL